MKRLGVIFAALAIAAAIPAVAQAAFEVSRIRSPAARARAAPRRRRPDRTPSRWNSRSGSNSTGGPGAGDLRDLDLELPPGLIENPNAVPVCTQADFHTPRSSPWEAEPLGRELPGPHPGRHRHPRSAPTVAAKPAPSASSTSRRRRARRRSSAATPTGCRSIFVPRIRQAEGDYGITLQAAQRLPAARHLRACGSSVWGTPWSVLHDAQRGNCLNEAEPGFGWAKCSVGRPLTEPRSAPTSPCRPPAKGRSPSPPAPTSWQGRGGRRPTRARRRSKAATRSPSSRRPAPP